MSRNKTQVFQQQWSKASAGQKQEMASMGQSALQRLLNTDSWGGWSLNGSTQRDAAMNIIRGYKRPQSGSRGASTAANFLGNVGNESSGEIYEPPPRNAANLSDGDSGSVQLRGQNPAQTRNITTFHEFIKDPVQQKTNKTIDQFFINKLKGGQFIAKPNTSEQRKTMTKILREQKPNANSTAWKVIPGASYENNQWSAPGMRLKQPDPQKIQERKTKAATYLNHSLTDSNLVKFFTPTIKTAQNFLQKMGFAPAGKISKNSLPMYIGRYYDPITMRIKTIKPVPRRYNEKNWQNKFNAGMINLVVKWNQYIRAEQQVYNILKKKKGWESQKKLYDQRHQLGNVRKQRIKALIRRLIEGDYDTLLTRDQKIKLAGELKTWNWETIWSGISKLGKDLLTQENVKNSISLSRKALALAEWPQKGAVNVLSRQDYNNAGAGVLMPKPQLALSAIKTQYQKPGLQSFYKGRGITVTPQFKSKIASTSEGSFIPFPKKEKPEETDFTRFQDSQALDGVGVGENDMAIE